MSAKVSSRDAIARRVVEARRQGTQIDKPKYDEVDDLLDVVLESARKEAEQGAQKIHAIAATLRGART